MGVECRWQHFLRLLHYLARYSMIGWAATVRFDLMPADQIYRPIPRAVDESYLPMYFPICAWNFAPTILYYPLFGRPSRLPINHYVNRHFRRVLQVFILQRDRVSNGGNPCQTSAQGKKMFVFFHGACTIFRGRKSKNRKTHEFIITIKRSIH